MGRDAARPSRGKQMVRNDHWSFDPDLEGARSLRLPVLSPCDEIFRNAG